MEKVTLSKVEKREIKLIMEKEFVDKVEEALCVAEFEGERFTFRTLVSLAKEAFLKGVLQMVKEKKELSIKFGRQVYLSEGGLAFAQDLIRAYGAEEHGREEHEGLDD